MFLFSGAHGFAEHSAEVASVEDVVAEHEADGIVAHELLAYDESLGKSVRRRLLRITEPYTEIASVAKKALEAGKVIRRGNNQNIPYAGQHQN